MQVRLQRRRRRRLRERRLSVARASRWGSWQRSLAIRRSGSSRRSSCRRRSAVVWLGTQFSDVLALQAPSASEGLGRDPPGLLLRRVAAAGVDAAPAARLPGRLRALLVLAVGVIGIFVRRLHESRSRPSRASRSAGPSGSLFPFLFVTIACGACSGFHGLVCGGTTSKQIARETHCRPVGYGAMLLEAFVALIALVTVMIVEPGSRACRRGRHLRPGASGSSSRSCSASEHLLFATVFGSMAFSTFVFDTLDVATRLGRYIIQELFDWRSRASGALATAGHRRRARSSSSRPPTRQRPGKPPTYMAFWTLFGTSNQLLAALTLLASRCG